jgi:hypothetical protein
MNNITFIFFRILLVILTLALFSSCGSAGSASSRNIIAPADLTAQQREVIYLLSSPNQQLMIFDYSTEDAFRGIEVWVEVYKNGELVEKPSSLQRSSDTAEKQNGHIAVTINENDSVYQWTLSINGDGKASHTGTYENDNASAYDRAFAPLDNPASIEDGEEIIIYRSLFNEIGTDIHAYDEQSLQENPELLNEYPFAFLIKCRFSKE